MMRDVFGVSISEGGLLHLLNRLAAKGSTAYEMIRRTVQKSSVIGIDETGMKSSGMKHWFWIWQRKLAMFIAVSSNRGGDTFENLVNGMNKNAVMVH